jgi:hypothetical protein
MQLSVNNNDSERNFRGADRRGMRVKRARERRIEIRASHAETIAARGHLSMINAMKSARLTERADERSSFA